MKFYDNEVDNAFFHIIVDICKTTTQFQLENKVERRARARAIGTLIYEMNAIPTGLISEGCITAVLEGIQKSKTEEHFHSRQEGGEAVLRYLCECFDLKAVPDPTFIKAMIDKFRQVHYTSKAENEALAATLSKYPELKEDWKVAYRHLGIKMGQFVRNKRFKKYDLSTFQLP